MSCCLSSNFSLHTKHCRQSAHVSQLESRCTQKLSNRTVSCRLIRLSERTLARWPFSSLGNLLRVPALVKTVKWHAMELTE